METMAVSAITVSETVLESESSGVASCIAGALSGTSEPETNALSAGSLPSVRPRPSAGGVMPVESAMTKAVSAGLQAISTVLSFINNTILLEPFDISHCSLVNSNSTSLLVDKYGILIWFPSTPS